MDLFFVVLGLLVLAFPIMAIVALVKSVGLGEQLRRVETRLAALERARAAPAPDVSERQAPAEPPPADADAKIRAGGRADCAGTGRGERARAGHRGVLARCAADQPRRWQRPRPA